MAHDPSRTEKATPKRRQQARDEGSVLRIPDVDVTIALWGNLFLFIGLWGTIFPLLAQQVAFLLKRAGQGNLTEIGLHGLVLDVASIVLRLILPFLGANLLIGLVSQIAQHGFHMSWKALTPKFTKLNPVPGFKKLFSMQSLVELAKSLVKFLILAGVAYQVLGSRIHLLLATLRLPLSTSLAYLQETLFILYRNVLIAMLFLALGDYLYKKYQFEKNLKMTKQEVKDESKDAEGNPEIKGKQKQLMFQAAMRRITTQVPKASVVITNPTHFAIALKYEEGSPAPVCVAKGLDHMAQKIREKAKEHGIPIVENPPLARALYRSVELDRPIPSELYLAVAQVLAYVYRLRGAA